MLVAALFFFLAKQPVPVCVTCGASLLDTGIQTAYKLLTICICQFVHIWFLSKFCQSFLVFWIAAEDAK